MILRARGKIFRATTYLETKSFKTVHAKFRGNFNFNNYPHKTQIYSWVHKFQTTRSINNLNKKVKTPSSDRKLTARYPDNEDAMRDLCRKESEKVPLKTFSRTWSFTCIVAKNLKEGASVVSIQNPDQA